MSVAIYRNIPDSAGHNAYRVDPDFARLLRLYASEAELAHVEPRFDELGALVGDELEQLALTADKNKPTLAVRHRNASPRNGIDKHPAYVELERYAFSHFGLAAMSHRPGVFDWPEKWPPIVKYGLTYLFVQAEFGLCCPLSMTDALTRTLAKFGDKVLVDRFFGDLTTQDFESLCQGSMFMTEQDAGSDVGKISTEAREEDGVWKLYGDKWFCSNADAGLAMVLARPAGGGDGTRGLTLFLLPRHKANGELNDYRLVRLKDKLGTRSMASGEITLEGAEAYVVGEPGSGFKQMTDMINMSRLSNGVRSAGMMRRSVNEALFFSRHREAFGHKLVDLPLMWRTLLKLMTPAEQGRSMVFHTADVLKRADAGDERAQKLLRILTPLIKFRTTRDARKVAGDGMEVRGGCGYIEEFSDARVLRDAHLGSIWEGTSNIVALDVIRSIKREDTLATLMPYLRECLDAAQLAPASQAVFEDALARVEAAVANVVDDRAATIDTRVVATALYSVTSAVFLAQEAAQIADDWRRLALAGLVLAHRVLPRDPLAPDTVDPALLQRLIAEEPMTREQAEAFVPG
ncbi:acyl-CoA dehydrogenase family protein [Salinisphaera aquimarina]|uniref:Acyl-CoA dehydrogenase family protein n=1 Tax=Salinisphaera aquimarina TaxID=2094031 RepID=A0ABV7ELP1_9GAMM